jgi:hypothetical protein
LPRLVGLQAQAFAPRPFIYLFKGMYDLSSIPIFLKKKKIHTQHVGCWGQDSSHHCDGQKNKANKLIFNLFQPLTNTLRTTRNQPINLINLQNDPNHKIKTNKIYHS